MIISSQTDKNLRPLEVRSTQWHVATLCAEWSSTNSSPLGQATHVPSSASGLALQYKWGLLNRGAGKIQCDAVMDVNMFWKMKITLQTSETVVVIFLICSGEERVLFHQLRVSWAMTPWKFLYTKG